MEIMESKPPPLPPPQNPKPQIQDKPKSSDFLNHLEAHFAKIDGVGKLLKILRYATRLILASSILPETLHLTRRLKSFESRVGLSRQALRLGKFVQDVNPLRYSYFHSKEDACLSVVAYGGEGLYHFVQLFIWVAKSGLIDSKHTQILQKMSAWAELIGYLGSIGLNLRELMEISEDEACVDSNIEIATLRGDGCREEEEREEIEREEADEEGFRCSGLGRWVDRVGGCSRRQRAALLASYGFLRRPGVGDHLVSLSS